MLCARSIVADPLQCRKKAEELLWKKCYYDVISSAKLLSKKSPLSPQEKSFLEIHIDSGTAKFTEHLLEMNFKLQKHEPPVTLPLNVLPAQACTTDSSDKQEPKDDVLESLQRTLVWLGDLSRYRIDLGISSSTITAKRLYYQAVILNPSNGLPFNQLGTLTSHDQSLCFESTFYYLRSMKSQKVFLGAEPNLKALLARLANNDEKLVSSFSQLIIRLALKPNEDASYEIPQLCQSTLAEMQHRLQANTCDFLLDAACCAVLCAMLHRESNNFQFTAAAAFSCSLFSHLLTKFQELFGLNKRSEPDQNNQQVGSPIKSEGQSEVSEDEEEETKRAKLRRRKIASSSDESSEDEFVLDSDSNESELDDESEQAETPEEALFDVPSECATLLPVLKIFTDWFRSNFALVQVTSNSAQNIWAVFAEILNVFQRCQLEDTHLYEETPLEEDWKFYGIPSMNQEILNFETSCEVPLSFSNSLRIQRIVSFGKWLSNLDKEPSFKYENGKFVYCFSETRPDHTESNDNKADLMKNMAQLWLKSEVQELERKLSPQAKRKKGNFEIFNLPYVYVVPDVTAFTKSMRLMKQIVKSQKLIMVIPNIVISEMDQLKKESSAARDCIRWLETCFRAGNRFVRTQRPNEHEAIPLLTYPKRKDKANWTLFQILECCHHLDISQRNISKQENGGPVVLFLSGLTDESEQHTRGLCASIGIEFKTTESLVQKGKSKKQ